MTTGLSPEGTTTATAALGALIRGHRLRIGLTQRELADLSTISVRAIRDLEKGKALRPRADTVRLIADALRLGPRARAALEEAARRGHQGGAGRHLLLERCAPPAPLHPLIGRQAEATVLADELRSGTERLVTVVGLSGVGKTRLALEAATRLHDTGIPVLWHTAPGAASDCLPPDDDPLATLTTTCAAYLHGPADPARDTGSGPTTRRPHTPGSATNQPHASEATARSPYAPGSAELRPYASEPAIRSPYTSGPTVDRSYTSGPAHPYGLSTTHGPAEEHEQPPAELLATVGDRDVLLVLDGVDTPRLDFQRLGRLLRELPGLRLLVTADTPWNVPGERLFLLAPLDTPHPGGTPAAEASAVRFLLSRIRRVRPDIVPDERSLADVAWVAHRLDGHPLALAAAASWLTVCDLPTLRHIVETDPAPLLDHLADGSSGSHLRDGVARALDSLPAGPRDLVARLCAADGDEFDLDEVVRLTGRPLPDCGRMVRALLIGGVIRPSTDHGRSAFRLLRVVRALAATPPPAPPASAAAGVTAAVAAPAAA
ncbi:helix-turn-helix domain-containing protein [Streptomyces sp. CC208A]|uniref:helix-turn-helix domain-containing protein n=1 Tax=Streptomyces sp. CC208A TaxID=3044573 RepID=UPI0024A9ACCB|nr:helix-turn-helix domain-containing protein [Streptomyces sp. CC208A]